MEEDKVIVVHRGYWDGSTYKDGEEELLFITPLQMISLDQFLDNVHQIIHADRRSVDYVLHSLVAMEDGAVQNNNQIRS